jgi:predicted 3-demethylubiquinone-9 3-methyltransferase (glyoxalase superfamily)
MTTITPFLMFEGKAGEAMELYASLFPDARIDTVDRYGPGEQGAEGSVRLARFTLAGQSVMCIDSPVHHAFAFTPSFSFFVDCETQEDQDRYAQALSEGGEWLMELGGYGFSRRFGWLNDRFGVSWQLNLP